MLLKPAILCAVAGISSVMFSFAAPPVVKTVPWVATDPLIPHDTWSGKSVRLKGTSDVGGANIRYTWDFGDGSPVVSGVVGNNYAIEASHAYTGPAGTVFSATLTVENTVTGEAASKRYYVAIRDRSLPVEVNVAIDEGLWALHKSQARSGSQGTWNYSGHPVSGTAAAVNAFEVNGHLEGGDASNPYSETVSRGMITIFNGLTTQAIGAQTLGNPDSNGNGYGVRVNEGNEFYQGGIIMDAIIASGTPDALAPSGPIGSGANPGIRNRTYRAIIQDMVDYYAWGQYDDIRYGGWRYGANQFPDNSAAQWGAIGIIPAVRNWGCTVPTWVKTANVNWLTYSQRADGVYGYTDQNPLSGVPYGTTPSGMVQAAMNGIGRGNPLWDRAETFLRNNFGNPVQYYDFKRNYYGMFAFVKAMLLHDSNNDGVAEPLQLLQSSNPSFPPIDWYAAETAKGDPVNGLARHIVNDQTAAGQWNGYGWFDTYGFSTAWAIMMLKGTLFEAGAPVAVAKVNPNPAIAGQLIQLDGSDSFHSDASKLIDSWEWDLDNDGVFDVSGPFASTSFPAVGNYPVGLRVTDNGSPEKTATTVVTVLVTTPPVAPTAVAGGPYSFCPGTTPWFLDGTASSNPDQGQSQPGNPGDTMIYEWDLDLDGQYDDATGAQPDVTAFFSGKPADRYLIQLRVTDSTATSYPGSGSPNLSDTDTAVVVVQSPTSTVCDCVEDLVARPKAGKVQLTWENQVAHHYNVYRGTTSGGPYTKIGSTSSTWSTYLDLSVVNNTRYYYVVRPANFLDEELCQSNEATALPRNR